MYQTMELYSLMDNHLKNNAIVINENVYNALK